MDALYSLKSRGDSFDSFVVASEQEEEDYELDFESESEQEDEWEAIGDDGDDSSRSSKQDEDVSVSMEPHVHVHLQYFKADTTVGDNNNNTAMAVDEPEREPMGNERVRITTDASAQIDDEPRRLVTDTTSEAGSSSRTQSKVHSALSPSSKSRNAKEVRPS